MEPSLDHNPYAPPDSDPGSSAQEPVDAILRSPGEYVVLGGLIASLLFVGYEIATGMKEVLRFNPASIALLVAFVGTGVVAFWLVARRRIAGAITSLVFYGVQLIKLTFSSGDMWVFRSLPTLYFDIWSSENVSLSLSAVAVVLFVFSLILLQIYRARHVPGMGA